MKIAKIEVIQVMNGKNDVRKHLLVDLDIEKRQYFEEEYDIDSAVLDEILKDTTLYLNMEHAWDKLEVIVKED